MGHRSKTKADIIDGVNIVCGDLISHRGDHGSQIIRGGCGWRGFRRTTSSLSWDRSPCPRCGGDVSGTNYGTRRRG